MTASSNKFKERNQVIEAYYRANKRKLVQKVSGRAGTPENAEDIVQNAFVNALQYWTPEVKDMDAWFGRILSSCLKRFMSDDRRYGTTDEFDEEMHEGVKMGHADQDLIDKVIRDIKGKNKQNQEILDLYFVKQLLPADIVEIMDVPNITVRQCVIRFKAEVREKYGAAL